MNANPYWMDEFWAEYRERRMAESNQLRLLDEIKAPSRLPIWRSPVLALARGLIILGSRLQNSVEGYRQPACETC